MNKDHQHKTTYILGARKNKEKGLLSMGRFYALDGSYGTRIYVDALSPHVISIFGKRGYGKSYTLGVFIEELASLEENLREDLSIIIIDTLGIFWTLKYPNTSEKPLLNDWNLKPASIPLHLFRPANQNEKSDDECTHLLSIPAHEISPETWCDLFQVTPTSPFGITLVDAIYQLKKTKKHYHLNDIFNTIEKKSNITNDTKNLASNFFLYAESLGLFHHHFNSINMMLKPGTINCLDLSMLPTSHIKRIVTGIISELIFQKRVQSRKREEQTLIYQKDTTSTLPKVWMFIDEAQLFLPATEEPYSKQVLREQWLRQGRQPGLSLVLATQQPSALDREVLSHSDLILCHRLTSNHDIQALHQIRPTYMKESIDTIIKKMGDEKGVCAIIDDTMEQAHICKIRPRTTWHAGHEPSLGLSIKHSGREDL